MQIKRLGPDDAEALVGASHLFDHPADPAHTRRFLTREGHHLLVGYEDQKPIGFISAVEMTHPDKGTEMFIYELFVDEAYRNRGFGKALVQAVVALAHKHNCYGMWVGTDEDNAAALATYAATGASRESGHVILSWTF